MSRTRRIITSCLPGRRRSAGDEGFSLIEVMVALALVITVMATTAGFFTTSLKQSNGQTQAQEAAVLADQQLDYTRSVAATSLVSGRTQTDVQAAIASPGRADLSQDVTAAPWPVDALGKTVTNYDPSATGASSQAVPISMKNLVGGTTYTVTTFIDQCYVSVAANQTCTQTDSGNGWVYRITVDVAYSLGGGRSCGATSCQFVASTLRDPGTDACFNVNVNYAGCSTLQPTITTITPNTVTTNSSTSVTLTGSNFDPGATVSIDTGGSVSNVSRVSSSSVTFTLATDNTVAAVGTRTIKLTNPNGKFAYGTLTITTSAMNVTSVSPSPVNTGTTTPLTISGSGFQSGSVVSIPSTAGTIVGTPTITANTITVSFAADSGASAIGTWPATVTNPDGYSKSANFAIQQAPVTLTAISPSSMAYASTRSFTLTGTGFNSGAQVTLDGNAVTEAWISATSMTVTLTSDPSAATHTFVVTNPDGGTASRTFIVTPTAISFVTSPDPSTSTNKTFTLTGGTFLSGATVKLDSSSSNISSAVVNNSGLMTVTLTNAPAAGSHTFTVTNPDGGSATDTFTVYAHISNATPNNNWVHSGTTKTVTLTGTGFVAGSSTVKVNGLTTGVSSVSITSTTNGTFKYKFSTAGSYTIQLVNSNGSVTDLYPVTIT